MDESTKKIALYVLCVLGLSSLACSNSQWALGDHFKSGSSANKCGETADRDFGTCQEKGEYCILQADVEKPDYEPLSTECGDNSWDGDHPIDGDKLHVGRCVEGVKDSALENAEDDPVCGCDRKTYPSPEHAHAAGVSIDEYGRCEQPSRQECGAGTGTCTSPDEICIYSSGSSCGAQGPGECIFQPKRCSSISDPVCGCDGKTYKNECAANKAGISVEHEGKCGSQNSNTMMFVPAEDSDKSWEEQGRLYPSIPLPSAVGPNGVEGLLNPTQASGVSDGQKQTSTSGKTSVSVAPVE